MAEPRARQRNKGQVFGDSDLRQILYAFGDPIPDPSLCLPTTVSTLDEILTDFIIETCHVAARTASYSRRQKIKIDDFRFVLRKNGPMLGRVNEQLFKNSYVKQQRRAIDIDAMGKEGAIARKEDLEGLAEVGGLEKEEGKKKGRGRGRRKRKAEGEAGDGAEERDAKRIAT